MRFRVILHLLSQWFWCFWSVHFVSTSVVITVCLYHLISHPLLSLSCLTNPTKFATESTMLHVLRKYFTWKKLTSFLAWKVITYRLEKTSIWKWLLIIVSPAAGVTWPNRYWHASHIHYLTLRISANIAWVAQAELSELRVETSGWSAAKVISWHVLKSVARIFLFLSQ